MNQPASSRLGAACGTVFALVLFAANGDGNQPFSGPRAVAGIIALTLAIPFLCYLCRILREGEGAPGWLAGSPLRPADVSSGTEISCSGRCGHA